MVAYYSDCPAILLCPPTARTGPKGPCWTTTTADCAECADASAGPAAASKGTPIPAAAKTSELIVLGVLIAPPTVRSVRSARAPGTRAQTAQRISPRHGGKHPSSRGRGEAGDAQQSGTSGRTRSAASRKLPGGDQGGDVDTGPVAELGQDVLDMVLDGAGRDEQLRGDLGVRPARRDQQRHLKLPAGERPPAAGGAADADPLPASRGPGPLSGEPGAHPGEGIVGLVNLLPAVAGEPGREGQPRALERLGTGIRSSAEQPGGAGRVAGGQCHPGAAGAGEPGSRRPSPCLPLKLAGGVPGDRRLAEAGRGPDDTGQAPGAVRVAEVGSGLLVAAQRTGQLAVLLVDDRTDL